MVTQPDELIAVRTLFKLARQELEQSQTDLVAAAADRERRPSLRRMWAT